MGLEDRRTGPVTPGAGTAAADGSRRRIKIGFLAKDLLPSVPIAVAAVVLCPGMASASFPGSDGVIAYSGAIDEACVEHCPPKHEGIWALDPITGDQLQLTSDREDLDPSFSPSGNLLVFDRGFDKSETTIFVSRADGTEARPLVKGSEPAFSPDGGQIVFVRSTGIFVTGTATGSPVRALRHQSGDSAPQWSSTGQILFERSHGRTDQLDVISPGGLRPRTVFIYEPPNGHVKLRADWSPNGRAVAIALCNVGLPLPRFATRAPVLMFRDGCEDRVWAPEGGSLAEPGRGHLAGRPETTCPDRVLGKISWQPVSSQTIHLPVMPCEPRARLRGEAFALGAPGHESRDERTCYTIRHKHRCFTTK